MVVGGECARLDAVVLGAYMECPALAQKKETLPTVTTAFSTFPLYLLPPQAVHPTPTAPNAFSLFDVYKHVIQVPSPIVPAPLPTSISDSRMGPPFCRFQEEIAFLCGRRELRL